MKIKIQTKPTKGFGIIPILIVVIALGMLIAAIYMKLRDENREFDQRMIELELHPYLQGIMPPPTPFGIENHIQPGRSE